MRDTSPILEELQLPYFRDVSELPAPLPTKEEIHASSNVVKGGEIHDFRRVVIVGQHFLVKYGRYAGRIEGENLAFIEQHLQIQAPRLYAMWREPTGELYIIMELIHGEPLNTKWPTLAEEERTLILGKMRSTFDKMRALPSPGFFGSVTGGKVPHALFWTPHDDPKVNGPFENHRELILGLAEKSWLNGALNKCRSYRADFFEKHLSRTLEDHTPTFTHTDLLRQNVMMQQISP
ncbi:MAG: hypothetical protein M1824_001712 [Vezdaea acicularis]|nr:MAG: hypothetical protein M1824_001712 [Vezdaea acicularis]